ncbi:hypothetical protein NQZ68_004904 [Dissostichus eleginoides]|nr:hypothetical protein NQZ68_004904 [Dissostichus eleginoides]
MSLLFLFKLFQERRRIKSSTVSPRRTRGEDEERWGESRVDGVDQGEQKGRSEASKHPEHKRAERGEP